MKPARLLRWYPRAWRDRYGEELLALIQDTADEGRPTWRLRLGVAWGGLRERGYQAARAGRAVGKRWLTGSGELGAIITAGMVAGDLPDSFMGLPYPVRGWRMAAFAGVLAVVALTVAVVLACGLAGLPALVRFLREGGWPMIRRRVARAAVATVVAGGGLAGVVIVTGSHSHTRSQLDASAAYAVAQVAAALMVAVAIGLWVTAAAATSRHLTLSSRVRYAQLILGAMVPGLVAAVLGVLNIWWAVTQTPACLIAVPVLLGGATGLTWLRLRVAARKGRRLRAATRGGG